MGMVLGFTTLGDDNIARVLADPPLVWKVLAPEDPEPYEEARGRPAPAARAPTQSPGWFSRLLGKKLGPVEPPAVPVADVVFVLGTGEGENTYLDKAWHGLHYLLTGSAWEGEPPLNFLVSGGEPVAGDEAEYGPARVLRSAQVLALHEALAGIDETRLRARFDPAAMMRLDIYPTIWDRDTAKDDTFGYCLEYFEILKSGVAKAAAQRLGIVVSLS